MAQGPSQPYRFGGETEELALMNRVTDTYTHLPERFSRCDAEHYCPGSRAGYGALV